MTMQIAASKSTNDILRDAKIVPLVTENCLPQAEHLKRRRVVILYASRHPQCGQTGSPSVLAQRSLQNVL